jgi:hypothetical protein
MANRDGEPEEMRLVLKALNYMHRFWEKALSALMVTLCRHENRCSKRLLGVLLGNNKRRFLGRVVSAETRGDVTSSELWKSAKGHAFAPRHFLTKSAARLPTAFDALSYRNIPDCMAHVRSSVIYSGGYAIVQPGLDRLFGKLRYQNNFIPCHDETHAAFSTLKLRSMDRGIFLAGDGSFNWYHWLIEILPKAMLLEHLPGEFDDYPLILPSEAQSIPTFQESLDLFDCKRPRIFISDDTACRFENLIWIDSPIISPFNMKAGLWPELGDTYNHSGVLREFRDQILGKVSTAESYDRPKKYFLARSHGRRN